MSLTENTEWLEAAQEHFETAIEEGNVPLARAVIEDMIDRGYGKEAMVLQAKVAIENE